VLRKLTIMPGNAREDDDAAVAEPMIAGPIHPNHMNLKEMQMELRERNVYFGDCFDRDSLVQRLVEARNEDRGGYGNRSDVGGYEYEERRGSGDGYGDASSNQQSYNGSRRWIYGAPVPPDSPPPGFYGN
jgi:hypothetical protein